MLQAVPLRDKEQVVPSAKHTGVPKRRKITKKSVLLVKQHDSHYRDYSMQFEHMKHNMIWGRKKSLGFLLNIHVSKQN